MRHHAAPAETAGRSWSAHHITNTVRVAVITLRVPASGPHVFVRGVG
ncbi:hypothetical protein STRIP9103_06263, partial [Streptomyces ipomoeae 91-03]